jgi:calcium/calmodulin-dependent protein kinase I
VDKCQEVRTLSLLRGAQCHRHIMQLHEFFWNGTDLNLVLELLPINLREWMFRQESFSEERAKAAAKSILSGLKVMSERNIVHRDIKEENIMFGVMDDLGTLKICDFGFAQDLSNVNGDRSRTSTLFTTTGICGSLGYLAPEIYQGVPYGTSVDLFSFGVLLYRILSAEKPWPDSPRRATQAATMQLQYRMDSERWQPVSNHGRALVRRLLTYCNERITAANALRHEWFGEQSMSILITDPHFPNRRTRNNSGTIILEDVGLRRTFHVISADWSWMSLTSFSLFSAFAPGIKR